MKLIVSILALALIVASCGGEDAVDDPEAAGGDGDAAADEDLDPAIAEAAAEAEELGLQFATSHDEIVARAEEEGYFNGFFGWADEDHFAEAIQPFIDRYPFLEGNIQAEPLSGTEARERYLLELESGALDDFAINFAHNEDYEALTEYCDWDVYGMAEAGILDIPLEMIDPYKRTVVAQGSNAGVFVYRLDAFEDGEREVPTSYDDLLDAEAFGPDSGFRMLGDVRLNNVVPMTQEWGIDGVVDWYTQFAETIEPTWARVFGPFITQMDVGAYDGYPFVNLHNTYDLMSGPPEALSIPDTLTGDELGIAFLEPVPIRYSDTVCAFNDEISNTPHTALLFLEWIASEEGQLIQEWPTGTRYQSHVYGPYENGLADLLEGMELSVIDWDEFGNFADYQQQINSAIGFPEPTNPEN